MGRVEGEVADRGPIIDVRLAPSPWHLRALQRSGRPNVSPMSIAALIDTGASCSAIDRNLVIGLGLVPTGTAAVHTPSTGAVYLDCALYDLAVTLGAGRADPLISELQVVEADFAAQGFLALIGRDVLNRCTFIFRGPDRRFEIEWGSGRSRRT